MIQAAPMVNKPGAGRTPQPKVKKPTPERKGDVGRNPVPDSKKRKGVLFSLSPDQKKKLEKLAKKENVSMSGYVGQLIDVAAWLDSLNK